MTIIIGWIGVGLGMCISLPQVIKCIREKSTKGVSVYTYRILWLAILCYLIRAIAIREVIFIVSNVLNLIVSSVMLYLFDRYPSRQKDWRTREWK